MFEFSERQQQVLETWDLAKLYLSIVSNPYLRHFFEFFIFGGIFGQPGEMITDPRLSLSAKVSTFQLSERQL